MSDKDDIPKMTDLQAAGAETISDMIARAYMAGEGAGYRRGYAQAAQEIWSKLQAAIPAPMDDAEIVPAGPTLFPSLTTARVERGTVKPMLLSALAKAPGGLTAGEAATVTGLKETTVRSKLNELRQDGKIIKVGERWAQSEFVAGPLKDEGVFE